MQKVEFVKIMSELRAHYQNAISDPDMWAASVSQYWKELWDRNPDAIRKAFDGAWKLHPIWMPSCGQIFELVEMHEKSQTVREGHRLTQGEPFADDHGPEKLREIITDLTQGKGMEVPDHE